MEQVALLMVARRDLHPGFIVTNLQGILDSIIYRLILEDFVFHALLGKRGGGGGGGGGGGRSGCAHLGP